MAGFISIKGQRSLDWMSDVQSFNHWRNESVAPVLTGFFTIASRKNLCENLLS